MILLRDPDLGLKDLEGHEPIIYAIDFKNPYALNLLLEKDK